MSDTRRFYEAQTSGKRRSAPAAARNREPITAVLREWLPPSGFVLELASGTGEHAVAFATAFPALEWQPSDIHPDALASIAEWQAIAGLANLHPPLILDAATADWPVKLATVLNIKIQEPAAKGGFDVALNLNMVHISPWSAALGLLAGAATVLKRGGALILYGPWLQRGVETASSNLEFDRQLRQRDPAWGLRYVEDFEAAALEAGLKLEQTRAMPANNLMLLFRLNS